MNYYIDRVLRVRLLAMRFFFQALASVYPSRCVAASHEEARLSYILGMVDFFPSSVAPLNHPIAPTLAIYCRWLSRSLGSDLQLHLHELPWNARTRHRVLDARVLQGFFTALHQQGVAVPG